MQQINPLSPLGMELHSSPVAMLPRVMRRLCGRRCCVALLMFWAALLPAPLLASPVQRVQGVVSAWGGGPIAGATVTLEERATHKKWSVAASEQGGIEFNALPTGVYTVDIYAPGYAHIQRRLVLSEGPIAGMNLSIKLPRQSAYGGPVEAPRGSFTVKPENPIQFVSGGAGLTSLAKGAAKTLATTAQASAAGTNPAADFSIYAPVISPNPPGFGFNLSDGGGISENEWLGNGEASPYDARASLTATDNGTITTFIATDANNAVGTDLYDSVLTGYFVGATAHTYRFQNNAWALLRTDTIAGYTSVPGSTAPADHTITYASPGPATQQGDVIWMALDDTPAVPQGNLYANRGPDYPKLFLDWNTETENGWVLYQNPPVPPPYTLVNDVPTGTGGPTSELSAAVTDTNTELQGLWNYTGEFQCPNDEEFQTGHTYELGVWLKQSGITDSTVTFNFTQFNLTHQFTGVTGTWQYFTWDFPAPPCVPSGSPYVTHRLDYNAPGTLYENGLHIFDTSYAAYALDPVVEQSWIAYKPFTLRIWSNFSDTAGGYQFWSLDSWLEPENRSRTSPEIGNFYETDEIRQHLPEALSEAKQIGANPWLIVSMSLSAEEWGNLVDYLAAPAGQGYAAKRPANHPGPYTADFPIIYLEVGNEEWGTQQTPLNFAYGQWVHYVASSSTSGKSYANLNQLKFITNGFFLQPNFGSGAIAQAPESSIVDYALYNGGDQSLTGDPYFQSDLIQLPATNKSLIDAIRAQQQVDASNGVIYSLAGYESGPGQDTPVHQGDTSLAAATATMDVDLYAQLRGFGPINFFLYGLGNGPYSSHSNFANGFRPHPVWEAMQMRNTYLNGDMVWTVGNTVPSDTNNNPLIGVYAFHDASNGGNQADVVVISRDLNNTTPMTLHFPGIPSGTGTLYTLTGDPRANNDTALNIPIGNQPLSGLTQSYSFSMPPGSIYIFKVPIAGAWSTQIPAPAAPTSLVAVANNSKVTLTWASVDGSTSYNIKRGTATGGPYTTIGTATGPGYTDSAVTNGTTYFYVVTAVNSGGESGVSNEVSATPNLATSAIVSSPPPLDGSDTGAWMAAPSYPLLHDFNTFTPDTATYKTLWDANNLYVLASVQDSTLSVSTGSNACFSGDSVEVYFSGTDTRSNSYGPTDFQYCFPYGSTLDLESKHDALAGVIFNQQIIPGGYQIAISIPWTTLGTTPVSGQQYGFDVMINDATSANNRVGKLAWWGTQDLTYADPALMGPLVLSSTPPLPATTTTLVATPASGTAVGETIELSTIVAEASGSAIPTGTVTFNISGPTTQSTKIKLDADGRVIEPFTPTKSGSYTFTATYNGSTKLSGSVSASVAEPVAAIPTTSAITLSPGSGLVYGAPLTVDVNVTSSSGAIVNGGKVALTIGTLTKTLTVASTGLASYSGVVPATGSYRISASYEGTTEFAASVASSVSVAAAPATTVTALATSPSTGLEYGAPWTLAAVVTSSAGTPTGPVTFNIEGPNSQSAVINVDKTGTATYVTTAPRDGSYTATAAYGGATNYAPSASATASVTIAGQVSGTKTTLTQSPSANLIAGGPWKLTAVVAATSGTAIPNGTVTFKWKGGTSTVTLDATGTAVYTGAVPPVGPQSVVAQYSGSSTFHPGNSNTLTFTVLGAPTTTTLNVSPTGNLVTGQSLTLTATVAPSSGTATATGSVVFSIGTATASVALNASGVATYTSNAPVPGSYTVSAAYSGSSSLATSVSTAVQETVISIPTTTTLTVAPSSGLVTGQSWTLTAVVAQMVGTTVPTGSVTFNIGSTTVSEPLNSSGTATYTSTAPAAGTYIVSAAYPGAAVFSSSTSASVQETVAGAPTTTTLSLSPGQILTSGQPFSVSATVAITGGSAAPTGSVVFSIGAITQTAALNSSGIANLSGLAPAAGTYAISAAYSGSAALAASTSAPISLTVVAAGTPIPITVPNNSFELDQAGYNVPQDWSFTSSPGTSNNYAVQQIGTNAGASTTLPGVDGVKYWEPSDFNPAIAPVGSSTSALTTSSSLGTFAANTEYLLTVALGSPADNDQSEKSIGFELLANGVVVSSFTSTAIPQGTGLTDYSLPFYTSSHPEVLGQNITVALIYTSTAQYNRQAYFDNVRLSQIYGVTQPLVPTNTTLSITPNSTTLVTGTSYTLTAEVSRTSGSDIPSGSIVFNIGSATQAVPLDGTGTATYTGTVPAVGNYSISAVYSGSTEFTGGTSNVLNETVVAVGSPVPIAIPNYSFEQNVSYNTPNNWTFTSSPAYGTSSTFAQQYISNSSNPPAADGTNYWSPFAENNSAVPYGTTTATLANSGSLGQFLANTEYTLTVALALPADNDSSYKTVTIELLANGVVVASFTPTNLAEGANFVDYPLFFYTSSNPGVVGQNITVGLVYTYTGPYNRAAYFDNVRLTEAVGVTQPDERISTSAFQ